VVRVPCVKPGDVAIVLQEMQTALGGKLVISIAAGVPIERLMAHSNSTAKIVRVMPNTPALVHRGASAYALGPDVSEEDAALVEEIFGAVGKVFRVPESALDAVTGVSGSGPAYIYTVIEAMADGGVLMGLSRDLALQLAAQTVVGAGEMVVQTQMHPAALRDMVTSPGGTTIAALEVLEKGGLRAALIAAVRSAAEKSASMRQIGS
jgi:pyrroline-5-carboxylate reductase